MNQTRNVYVHEHEHEHEDEGTGRGPLRMMAKAFRLKGGGFNPKEDK